MKKRMMEKILPFGLLSILFIVLMISSFVGTREEESKRFLSISIPTTTTILTVRIEDMGNVSDFADEEFFAEIGENQYTLKEQRYLNVVYYDFYEINETIKLPSTLNVVFILLDEEPLPISVPSTEESYIFDYESKSLKAGKLWPSLNLDIFLNLWLVSNVSALILFCFGFRQRKTWFVFLIMIYAMLIIKIVLKRLALIKPEMQFFAGIYDFIVLAVSVYIFAYRLKEKNKTIRVFAILVINSVLLSNMLTWFNEGFILPW